jgi:hypothetical protein
MMRSDFNESGGTVPPRTMVSIETETRRAIASFLYCEAFELRYTPEIARAVSGLAARVESNEPIPDLLANVGATGRGSPYAVLRKPRALRALLGRQCYSAYCRAVSRLLGLDA